VRGNEALEHVVHLYRRLAVELDAAVAVMVGREPAEALAAHFKAQVLADGLCCAFRETLDDLGDAFALCLAVHRLADRLFRSWCRNAVESHQVHVRAAAVLRDLQQIDETVESRLARELRSDIRHLDLLDRVDFDVPYSSAVVAVANLHARRMPDADAARDLAALNAGSQALGEVHGARL